jgi:hypothetical protein
MLLIQLLKPCVAALHPPCGSATSTPPPSNPPASAHGAKGHRNSSPTPRDERRRPLSSVVPVDAAGSGSSKLLSFPSPTLCPARPLHARRHSQSRAVNAGRRGASRRWALRTRGAGAGPPSSCSSDRTSSTARLLLAGTERRGELLGKGSCWSSPCAPPLLQAGAHGRHPAPRCFAPLHHLLYSSPREDRWVTMSSPRCTKAGPDPARLLGVGERGGGDARARGRADGRWDRGAGAERRCDGLRGGGERHHHK